VTNEKRQKGLAVLKGSSQPADGFERKEDYPFLSVLTSISPAIPVLALFRLAHAMGEMPPDESPQRARKYIDQAD
jgi:hypothetical protein